MKTMLDTCGLVYWTLDPERLSKKALDLVEKAEELVVSSISLWEIGIKITNGKLEFPLSVRDYFDRVSRLNGLRIVPVDERIWLKNLELDWKHRDPADRTIVATAILEDLSLVTSDSVISRFYSRTIW